MLVSSRALSEVQQIADRVVIIDKGRLVRDGRLDELTGGGCPPAPVWGSAHRASWLVHGA